MYNFPAYNQFQFEWVLGSMQLGLSCHWMSPTCCPQFLPVVSAAAPSK